MSDNFRQPAVLLLEDGTVFHGTAIGIIGTTTGEIAFNTGMTGYQEVFTDPSYYGQVLIMNSAHIGNYGVHDDEAESDSIKVSGIVIKNFSQYMSRVSGSATLQEYLERDNKVGIANVDTRALVRHIRDKGAMNCIISSENTDVDQLKKELAKVPSMQGLELSSKVSTKEPYDVGKSSATHKVALLDLGVKKNIIRCLVERDCKVRVFPHDTSFNSIVDWHPDGVMLSNGPGDPAAMPEVAKVVRKIVEADIPVFGICLGHQVLAMGQGLETEKMHNGHRGINHPIKNLITGKGEITSQNHGFVVKYEQAESNKDITVTHKHLNDGTLAGIRLKNHAAFSVQYHPEASAGPHDSRYLFDEFINDMVKAKKAVPEH